MSANAEGKVVCNQRSLENQLAAAAKLLQSCLTLCDTIDSSPPGSPIPDTAAEAAGIHRGD